MLYAGLKCMLTNQTQQNKKKPLQSAWQDVASIQNDDRLEKTTWSFPAKETKFQIRRKYWIYSFCVSETVGLHRRRCGTKFSPGRTQVSLESE